jgi:hypothetical protein
MYHPFSFEADVLGRSSLVKHNRGSHFENELRSRIVDAIRESPAACRRRLAPERENGQRLAGYAGYSSGTDDPRAFYRLLTDSNAGAPGE